MFGISIYWLLLFESPVKSCVLCKPLTHQTIFQFNLLASSDQCNQGSRWSELIILKSTVQSRHKRKKVWIWGIKILHYV